MNVISLVDNLPRPFGATLPIERIDQAQTAFSASPLKRQAHSGIPDQLQRLQDHILHGHPTG